MIGFLIFLILSSVSVHSIFTINTGPKYSATKGEVWPKPQNEITELTYFTFDPSKFKITVTNNTCDILTSAIERYSYIVKSRAPQRNPTPVSRSERRRHAEEVQTLDIGILRELQLQLTEPCEHYPYLEMNERYTLTVSEVSVLVSSSVWGILRGLETFAQKFYFSNVMNVKPKPELRINTSIVVDFPEYAHRGLLLDTGRHFISVAKILLTLDAMAINKMNVLHWHIVDDQSFPYQSEKFPDLSLHGAYHKSMVYTKDNIAQVVEYARLRGIRVLPEFDMPGHTQSWGKAYPNILTACYRGNEVEGLGPMNPIQNITYKTIRDLFREVQTRFPDKYLHIGGDEVKMDCWKSNPEIRKYMKEKDFNVDKLHALFIQNIIPLLADGSKIIVWQDVFDKNIPLTNDTLVQVWKEFWAEEMVKVLQAGHRLLFSSGWYLTCPRNQWWELYMVDPRHTVREATGSDTLLAGVIGGEACMWGEMVDDRNVISRVWPRASAVAERLWIAPSANLGVSINSSSLPPIEAYRRMEEHVCRMNRRGIAAQPANGPGFCLS